jgi:molybdate transport system regulatory protein
MYPTQLKVHISLGSATIIDQGRADLLDAIIECGSITFAAKKLCISYRYAWDLVDSLNRYFQEPLVVTRHGGRHGGGATVTRLGKHILTCYRNLVKKANNATSSEIHQITLHIQQADPLLIYEQ